MTKLNDQIQQNAILDILYQLWPRSYYLLATIQTPKPEQSRMSSPTQSLIPNSRAILYSSRLNLIL